MTDLKRCNLYQEETAQWNALSIYMNNVSTARIYAKSWVFFSKTGLVFLGVDVATADNVTLALWMQAWRAFSSEGFPLWYYMFIKLCLIANMFFPKLWEMGRDILVEMGE